MLIFIERNNNLIIKQNSILNSSKIDTDNIILKEKLQSIEQALIEMINMNSYLDKEKFFEYFIN